MTTITVQADLSEEVVSAPSVALGWHLGSDLTSDDLLADVRAWALSPPPATSAGPPARGFNLFTITHTGDTVVLEDDYDELDDLELTVAEYVWALDLWGRVRHGRVPLGTYEVGGPLPGRG